MGNIDECMTPLRHFNHALRVNHGVVFRCLVVPKTQRSGFVLSNAPGFGDLFKRSSQLMRIIHIQINAGPLFGRHAPFHKRLRLQTRLNRKKAQAGRHFCVVSHFGRAHGGATSAGRHDPATITREKHGIDQLGFAARELCDKGNHDFIRADLGL